MSFSHLLKRAFANRLVYYVVAALVALGSYAFSGKAAAQSCNDTTGVCTYPTQGEAYAGAAAEIATVFPYTVNASLRRIGCIADGGRGILSGNSYNIRYQNQEVPGGATGQCAFHGVGNGNAVHVHQFPANTGCSVQPAQMDWANNGPTDSGLRCFKGCTYQNALEVGGEYDGRHRATPTGSLCVASSDAPVPEVDTDGDGVPDTSDAFPNDPSETQDTDGDGIGDNADFASEDPTDGEDTPGEEDGDDEGDNTASGGGTCAAPPSCGGDGIACAQLFQLWKLRCQGTAQGTVTGNPQDCTNAITVSSPDPVANAQLLTLRKIACAGGGQTGNGGDANGNGVADVLEGEGTPGEDSGEDPDPTRFGLGINTDLLDKENIFGGGQCPTMPSFSIKGKSINPADYSWWCDFLAIARIMIPLLGGWAALQILMGRYT